MNREPGTWYRDPAARALIGLALEGEQRLPRNRERVRRGLLTALAAPAALGATDGALAAGKAAGLAAGAAGAGTKAGAVFATATWLKAVPIVVATIAAGTVAVRQLPSLDPAPRAAAPVVAAPAPPAVKTPPATQRVPVEAATPTLEQSPAAPTRSPSKPSKPSLAADEAATPAAPPSLAAELEALQRAQRALNAGNPSGALAELRGASGQALLAERTAVEVFAHCGLGNIAAAREKAALFRQLAPRSPLLPRVNASCAGE